MVTRAWCRRSRMPKSAVRPAMGEPNITLVTEAKVLRLHTNASGREVTGVVAEVKGAITMFTGDIVAVSCGAVNSSALLLRSTNDKHPDGLANGSGQDACHSSN